MAAGFTPCCVCRSRPGPPGAGFAAHDVTQTHPNEFLCDKCREMIVRGGGNGKCPLCKCNMHRSTYAKDVDGKWAQKVRLSVPVYPEQHRHFDSEIAVARERLGLDDLEELEALPVMSEADIEARNANEFGKFGIRLTDYELGEGAGESESGEIVPVLAIGGGSAGGDGGGGAGGGGGAAAGATRNFSSELRIRAQQIDAGAVEDQLEFDQVGRAAQQALERDRDALARIEGVGRAGVVGNHGGALMHLNR